MAAAARHVPLRRCAVCRTVLPQGELIRFARDEAGEWKLDADRRAGGRGTWVCRQASCHDRRALGRAFRAQAPAVAGQLAQLAQTDPPAGTAPTAAEGEPQGEAAAGPKRGRLRVRGPRKAEADRDGRTKSQNGGIDG